ncbi:MAG: hypothetical protein K8J09_17155 [Planctomycetes bacterium]|nr:hypothetical protein [Planctomycetota bacterium]MCC7395508.1 hypothetical protein [Planctomycetota bacterium]
MPGATRSMASASMEHSRGHLSEAQLDSAFHFGGLVVRVVGYAALAAVASHYDFGRALLAGLFYGDLAATAAMFVRGAAGLIDTAGELLLLLLVALCVGGMLRAPDDNAARAVLTLAALGVFTSRIGKELMTRLRLD